MTLRRVAFWAACVAVPLGIVSDLLYAAAEHFPLDPAALVRLDVLAADPTLLRWAAFTDFCSFYLPLVPIALYLRARFAGRDALLDLYTVGALGFATIGGCAALVLGVVGPTLAAAGPSAGPATVIVARALEDAVLVAIWQIFGAIALGTFYLGLGRLLRPDHRRLGSFTMLLGVDAVLVAVARIVGLEPLVIVTVAIWLPLMTVWTAWLAASELRGDRPDLAFAA